MLALITDAQFDSVATFLAAGVAIIPATLAAVWSRTAKKNSGEAKSSSAEALHEVKSNGGMSDPDPTLKDYIKFVGQEMEDQGVRLENLDKTLQEHLRHGKMMDEALAEVYMQVMKEVNKGKYGTLD